MDENGCVRARPATLGAASPCISVAWELLAPRIVAASTRFRLDLRRLLRTAFGM
jgi:hypothetical protein